MDLPTGLYRQVVLIQRCISVPEVACGAAYSGLSRQVVLLYKWSSRQVSLYVHMHVIVVMVTFQLP